MRIAVAILNLAIFAFASCVLVAEGPPAPGEDTLFVLWSQTTHLFSAGMIFGSTDSGRWSGLASRAKALARREKSNAYTRLINGLIFLAIACNVVLLGLVGWHLAGQYHHPRETGVVAFAIFMVSIPVLSLGVLLRSAPR
jgi:hypothetical protein